MRFKSDSQRKAVFSKYNKFSKKKYYHGTAGFRGRVPMAEGLIPPSQQESNPHAKQRDEMRGPEFDDYVFLTTNKDLAQSHAKRRAQFWDDTEYGPSVYEVELEESEVVPDTFDPVRYPDSFKYKGIISSDKLKRVKFTNEPFDPKKTLELLDAGMLDPATLSDEQKAQVESIQEETKKTSREALKRLNERIEQGNTYRSKNLWMSAKPCVFSKKFVKPDNLEKPEEYAPVEVDVKKFNELWKRNPDNYFEDDAVATKERYDGIFKEVKKSDKIYMPEVYAKPGPTPDLDTLDVADGRHRSAAIRDQGLKEMKIVVPNFQKDWFDERIGVKN